MAQTLPSVIAWWARMRPDQPAIALDGDILTYRAYQDWSGRVAAMLLAEGLQPGERVAICASNSLAYAALILGVIRAGGIVSPVNFRYTAREIADLCATTEPRFFFAQEDLSGKVRAAGYEPLDMAALESLREGEPVGVPHDPDPDAPVVIIATSGSTATPKGVVYTNRSMTAYATNWSVEEPSTAPDRASSPWRP